MGEGNYTLDNFCVVNIHHRHHLWHILGDPKLRHVKG